MLREGWSSAERAGAPEEGKARSVQRKERRSPSASDEAAPERATAWPSWTETGPSMRAVGGVLEGKNKSNKAENGEEVEGALGPAGLREGFSGLRTGRPKAELPVLGAPWTDECLTDERGGPA